MVLEKSGGIPVQTEQIDRELLTETKRIFDNGKLLLIFPEGKIYHDGELGEFKDVFLKVALQFNIPIIPVTIKGSEKSLGEGSKNTQTGKRGNYLW